MRAARRASKRRFTSMIGMKDATTRMGMRQPSTTETQVLSFEHDPTLVLEEELRREGAIVFKCKDREMNERRIVGR